MRYKCLLWHHKGIISSVAWSYSRFQHRGQRMDVSQFSETTDMHKHCTWYQRTNGIQWSSMKKKNMQYLLTKHIKVPLSSYSLQFSHFSTLYSLWLCLLPREFRDGCVIAQHTEWWSAADWLETQLSFLRLRPAGPSENTPRVALFFFFHSSHSSCCRVILCEKNPALFHGSNSNLHN